MTHKNFQTLNSLYIPLKIRLEEELNKKSIELKKILIYRFVLINNTIRLFRNLKKIHLLNELFLKKNHSEGYLSFYIAS
jgi:hypothetical protein